MAETKFYADANVDGNYLGGYSEGNALIPGGAVEVPFPPEYVSQLWNGTAWVGSPPVGIPDTFISNDQFIIPNNLLTLAHGLTGTPTDYTARLVNVTPEHGYTTGEVIGIDHEQSKGNHTGMNVLLKANNLEVKFGDAINTFALLNKVTGKETAITNINWRIRFRAWIRS